MRRIHIAFGVTDIAASVTDYSRRLGAGGQLRHPGWEDEACAAFTVETDVNGIAWERFTARQQAEEIRAAWPDADYSP